MSELSFAEKLRMEQQAREKASVQEQDKIIDSVLNYIKTEASNKNRLGICNIKGYYNDCNGWDPALYARKRFVRHSNIPDYYDENYIGKKLNQKIKELGFTDFEVIVTKEDHEEYETVMNWLGISHEKRINERCVGEDYFIWIDISW